MIRNIDIEKITRAGLYTGCGLCQAVFPCEVSVVCNGGYIRPQALLSLRLFGRYVPRYCNTSSLKLALSTSLRENLRNFKGMAQRTLG